MADEYTGKGAVLDWGGTEFDALTGISIEGSNSVASTEVSTASGTGRTIKSPGPNNHRITTTIVVPKGITEISAFAPGTSAAAVAYPGGNVSGHASLTWAEAVVQNRVIANQTNTHTTLQLTLECTGDPTEAAVTP